MLYQDTLTGMLHEVPDAQVQGWGFAEDPYGVGEVYDGLGNPVGWSPFRRLRRRLGRLIRRAAPFATPFLGPYGPIIRGALPAFRQAFGPMARQRAQALRQQAMRQFGEAPPEAAPPPAEAPMPAGAPAPMPPVEPSMPPGWAQGPGPPHRRLYLRCATWRGPGGLVPINAVQPGAIPAAVPGAIPGVVPGAIPGAIRVRMPIRVVRPRVTIRYRGRRR